MRRYLPKLLLVLLVLGAVNMGFVATADAATTDRNGSFTTDRGTAVSLNATLEHDGTEGDTPVLYANKEYKLSILVKMTKIGNDARDLHDFEFKISMETDSLLGSGKPVYSAYYYDKSTKMTDAGDAKTFEFVIFLTGEIVSDTTNMDIEFKVKEDVPNRVDPTTTFDNLGYQVQIEPEQGSPTLVTSGSEVENRFIQVPSAEGTNVRISVDLNHDGLVSGKPSLLSNQFYNVSVNFTIIDLGADPENVFDLEVFVSMEDSSITDYIPGNSAVKYFSAYGLSEDPLVDGQSKVFDFFLLPSTNMNDTEVKLKFTFKFTEDISGGFDNDEQLELSVETKLNDGLSNAGQATESSDDKISLQFGFALLFLLPAAGILRRKNQ